MDLKGASCHSQSPVHIHPLTITQAAPCMGALLLLCLSKPYWSNPPKFPNPLMVPTLRPAWVGAAQRAPALQDASHREQAGSAACSGQMRTLCSLHVTTTS